MFFRRPSIASRSLQGRQIREALLQREVVGDAEKPTPKVLTRATQVEVSKQSQKNFLDNLFRIVDGQAQ